MSKCPVNRDGDASAAQEASWSNWFSSKPTGNVDSAVVGSSAASSSSSSCPVGERGKLPAVASVEEAAKYAQTPQPDQRFPLKTDRQVSSIARAAAAAAVVATEPQPHHQDGHDAAHWVYPSEQQLYNAMRRKGWKNIPEESIPVVLQIHNGINEGTWGKILDWEGTPHARLVRFQGRPRHMTPKAFIMSKVLRLYNPPFDRHDWFVENPNVRGGGSGGGQQLQRYVIDYYMIEPADPALPPQPYVDARPALEGPRGISMRAQRFLQDAFPGITAYWKRYVSTATMDDRKDGS